MQKDIAWPPFKPHLLATLVRERKKGRPIAEVPRVALGG